MPEGRGAGAENVHGVHGSVAGLQGSSSCPELCWVLFREDPMSPVKRTDKASRERSTVPRSASSRRSVSSRLSPGLCRSVRARGQPPTCGQLHWAKAVAVTFAPSQDCLRLRVVPDAMEGSPQGEGERRHQTTRKSGVGSRESGVEGWASQPGALPHTVPAPKATVATVPISTPASVNQTLQPKKQTLFQPGLPDLANRITGCPAEFAISDTQQIMFYIFWYKYGPCNIWDVLVLLRCTYAWFTSRYNLGRGPIFSVGNPSCLITQP